jgi:hypothetical protein
MMLKQQKKKKNKAKAKVKRVFGTSSSNCDSVIAIHNHWVPLKKILFGTSNLSEV